MVFDKTGTEVGTCIGDMVISMSDGRRVGKVVGGRVGRVGYRDGWVVKVAVVGTVVENFNGTNVGDEEGSGVGVGVAFEGVMRYMGPVV